MKNKSLVRNITFFVTIFMVILVLNIFDSETKKPYSFERFYNNNQSILKFKSKPNKTNESKHIMYVNSDEFIVEKDIKSLNVNEDTYKFYLQNFQFQNKQILNATLPKGASILFCNTNKIIFTKSFNLFEYNFKLKTIKNLKFEDLKVNIIKSIFNSDTKFLALAQYYDGKLYKTGFYLIDLVTHDVKLCKELEQSPNDNFIPHSLQYVGKFLNFKKENAIIYSCEKFSKIYIFNSLGKFTNEFQTDDQVPLPIIAQNKEGNTFYSREGTWYSNIGVFLKENKLYVFSAAVLDKEFITIDEYDRKTYKYIQSYKLFNEDIKINNIVNMHFNNNEVIICLDFYYLVFEVA